MTGEVFYLSCIAGFCTTFGAILLFVKRYWSNRSLAFFLGLASGVMVAVVVFDMLPSAFLFSRFYVPALGLIVGFISLGLFDNVRMQKISRSDSLLALGYLIMVGIMLHDLPEGMAIALGGEMKERTGLVIAMGIAIHNIPEGMAIAAPFLMGGMKRSRIFFKTFLISLITPLGTLIGEWAAMTVPGCMPALLGFASGVMIYLVVFQLWPEARGRDRLGRWFGFITGMIVIALATFI
ncbi:MAG: ZIP family metal transporter [Deltaproteobacteria bacterium]